MPILRIFAAFCLAAASAVHAQDYPARPLTLVIPFSAGGAADMVGRILAQKLTATLGQAVVVSNRPGAGGNIGTEVVARAQPDGYTLLLTSSAFVINPNLYAKIPYDALKDFRPVSQPAMMPNVLVVPKSLPVKSVDELVAYGKTHPLSYASAGVGTGTHLAGEMFKLATGLDLIHVPYKGGAAANTDLLAGRVALSFATLPSAIQYIEEGRLLALAMTTAARWPGLPEVPTMQQAGFKDFDINTWIGLLAPAGTPDAVVQRLHSEVVRIVREPDVREQFRTLGMLPVADSPAEFGAQISAELSMYKKLVDASGARPD